MTFDSLAELRTRVGNEVGTSDWLVVSQERIQAFADATGDHQWIHVDPDRARRETPFGSTIAHGFLTLSLVSALLRSALSIGGLRMAINYGLNRVRFVSPVPAGARLLSIASSAHQAILNLRLTDTLEVLRILLPHAPADVEPS